MEFTQNLQKPIELSDLTILRDKFLPLLCAEDLLNDAESGKYSTIISVSRQCGLANMNLAKTQEILYYSFVEYLIDNAYEIHPDMYAEILNFCYIVESMIQKLYKKSTALKNRK